MLKVARVSTVPHSILSLTSHYEYLQSLGCDITIICSPGEGFEELSKTKVSQVYPLEIKRKIDPLSDIKSVLQLAKYLKQQQFDILHSNTPKAAIVAAFAGILAGVPVRMHTFTGQRWVTLKGPKRWLLMLIDWVVVTLNTHSFTDSPHQTQFMIESLHLLKDKISWVHKGAFTGVDFSRYDFEKLKKEENRPLRISFLGRVVNDKGICELLDAFALIRKEIPDCELLIIGPYEKEHDPIPEEYEKRLFSQEGVIAIGRHEKPEEVMINSDVFCLPSYREGFPTVVLEAAALKIPTVGTNIYGMVDAVVNNQTGILIEPKDVVALTTALKNLISNEKSREMMGAAAYTRTKDSFNHHILAEKLMERYRHYSIGKE